MLIDHNYIARFITQFMIIKIVFLFRCRDHVLVLLTITCPIRLEPYQHLTVFSVTNPVQKTSTGGEIYLVEGNYSRHVIILHFC